MITDLSAQDAHRIKAQLMNAPVAPGGLAPAINVGTDQILDIIDEQYFARELAEGISSFKYLEGDYGTGKTQFIHCLARRAHEREIVTAIVTIGQQCPFSSPLAIFRNVMSSFLPPPADGDGLFPKKGIEILLIHWIRGQLRKMGVTPGNDVPEAVRVQIERPFTEPWFGAPDTQMVSALQGLGRRLTAIECGAQHGQSDFELIGWIRGEGIRSPVLRQTYSLFEPTNDTTAFQRLGAALAFLRERLSYRGFFVAFDEGSRTVSFRRGTVKQKQAIENMLTMINKGSEEPEFGGVMFLYAAALDFRTDVIQNTYTALRDRIGSVAFIPGQPMTPLIKLDDLNSDSTLMALGERLLDVFAKADAVSWDLSIQSQNMRLVLDAQKKLFGFMTAVPPRYFVFHWCRFIEQQRMGQRRFDPQEVWAFVERNQLPEGEEA